MILKAEKEKIDQEESFKMHIMNLFNSSPFQMFFQRNHLLFQTLFSHYLSLQDIDVTLECNKDELSIEGFRRMMRELKLCPSIMTNKEITKVYQSIVTAKPKVDKKMVGLNYDDFIQCLVRLTANEQEVFKRILEASGQKKKEENEHLQPKDKNPENDSNDLKVVEEIKGKTEEPEAKEVPKSPSQKEIEKSEPVDLAEAYKPEPVVVKGKTQIRKKKAGVSEETGAEKKQSDSKTEKISGLPNGKEKEILKVSPEPKTKDPGNEEKEKLVENDKEIPKMESSEKILSSQEEGTEEVNFLEGLLVYLEFPNDKKGIRDHLNRIRMENSKSTSAKLTKFRIFFHPQLLI